jgi:hypothetical protein
MFLGQLWEILVVWARIGTGNAKILTDVLKEHLGTHPKTRYAGICGEVK